MEVMVVLAVVALAVAIVVPRIDAVGGVAVEAAARGMADAIAFGRERAILGGVRMRVVMDLDEGTWALGRAAREAAAIVAEDDEVAPLGRATRLPRGVRVVGVDVGGQPVARGGRVALDLLPEGDALPVRIELASERGTTVAIVVPPASGRPVVVPGARS